MNWLKIGTVCEHPRFGKGIVTSIDKTTYSIIMVVAKYEVGEIVSMLSELSFSTDNI